jgi:hypothetical protein
MGVGKRDRPGIFGSSWIFGRKSKLKKIMSSKYSNKN